MKKEIEETSFNTKTPTVKLVIMRTKSVAIASDFFNYLNSVVTYPPFIHGTDPNWVVGLHVPVDVLNEQLKNKNEHEES